MCLPFSARPRRRAPSVAFLALLVLSAFLVTGCVYPRPLRDDTHRARAPAKLPALPGGAHLKVLVLGDWGTGGRGQRELAHAVARTHGEDPPHLVLTVGDNLYPSGVRSETDPLWARVFEGVYVGPFWGEIPFYPTLGNHDHRGEPQAQVRYSARNPRWRMPALHYAFREPLPAGGSVLFVALDTDPIHGGRGDPAQLAWADSVLARAREEWVVAYGHHPMATVGWRRPSRRVREALLPLMEGRASLYLAGHNHTTELLTLGEGLLQGVCGGGGGRDNPYRVSGTERALAAFTHGGWCFLRIWQEAMAVELHDRTGALRFRHLVRRPAGGSTLRP